MLYQGGSILKISNFLVSSNNCGIYTIIEFLTSKNKMAGEIHQQLCVAKKTFQNEAYVLG